MNNTPRTGCVDIWNAFMLKNASFAIGSDMPVCPCTAQEVPQKLISYVKAKQLYKERIHSDPDFHVDAFVHFYIDDHKFDGKKSSIWLYPEKALEILCHFSGVITPDFSTYSDFPDPLKRYNTYRMRAFGFWLTTKGLSVINNVRWNTKESWDYCFDGIPYGTMVAIGTVASKIRLLENRSLFEAGLIEMVRLLNPHTIIVYGSAHYPFFEDLHTKGINIISFESDTSVAFSSRKKGGIWNE